MRDLTRRIAAGFYRMGIGIGTEKTPVELRARIEKKRRFSPLCKPSISFCAPHLHVFDTLFEACCLHPPKLGLFDEILHGPIRGGSGPLHTVSPSTPLFYVSDESPQSVGTGVQDSERSNRFHGTKA
jgi:hypothetical protein